MSGYNVVIKIIDKKAQTNFVNINFLKTKEEAKAMAKIVIKAFEEKGYACTYELCDNKYKKIKN